ncbi:MAG: hypothetical protein P9M14_15885 [Candidatus Alcyoniella australis]|nr:hypothetical protein [Candidatus Alcyoniella australis]
MAQAKSTKGVVPEHKLFDKHAHHANHLCELTRKREMAKVAKFSKGAKYVCHICGRASAKAGNLCEPIEI